MKLFESKNTIANKPSDLFLSLYLLSGEDRDLTDRYIMDLASRIEEDPNLRIKSIEDDFVYFKSKKQDINENVAKEAVKRALNIILVSGFIGTAVSGIISSELKSDRAENLMNQAVIELPKITQATKQIENSAEQEAADILKDDASTIVKYFENEDYLSDLEKKMVDFYKDQINKLSGDDKSRNISYQGKAFRGIAYWYLGTYYNPSRKLHLYNELKDKRDDTYRKIYDLYSKVDRDQKEIYKDVPPGFKQDQLFGGSAFMNQDLLDKAKDLKDAADNPDIFPDALIVFLVSLIFVFIKRIEKR